MGENLNETGRLKIIKPVIFPSNSTTDLVPSQSKFQQDFFFW